MKSKISMEHRRNDADSRKTCAISPFSNTRPTRIGPALKSQSDLKIVLSCNGVFKLRRCEYAHKSEQVCKISVLTLGLDAVSGKEYRLYEDAFRTIE